MKKNCSKCQTVKPLSCFSKRGNGYQTWCKPCSKIAQRAAQQKNQQRIKLREAMHRKKYPEKWEAKRALNTAVRAGSLPPVEKGYEYHHWSYKSVHQTDVVSLLNENHKALHRLTKYVPTARCFCVKSTGELLDTRQKTLRYCSEKFGIDL